MMTKEEFRKAHALHTALVHASHEGEFDAAYEAYVEANGESDAPKPKAPKATKRAKR